MIPLRDQFVYTPGPGMVLNDFFTETQVPAVATRWQNLTEPVDEVVGPPTGVFVPAKSDGVVKAIRMNASGWNGAIHDVLPVAAANDITLFFHKGSPYDPTIVRWVTRFQLNAVNAFRGHLIPLDLSYAQGEYVYLRVTNLSATQADIEIHVHGWRL